MKPKNKLKNRAERSGNIVSIAPNDLTSHAYKKDTSERPQTSFSAYLSIAILVFMVFIFLGIYEWVMGL